MRNYGLKISEKKPDHYTLGGGMVPFKVLQLDKDWTPYLPIKEFQNLNGVEPYACVSFTILTCIEILIKRKYGLDRNYSDRFLAYVSGTKDKQGNDPHEVCEFLRKIGVPPEHFWPFDSAVDTFEKYYEQPAPKLYELAQEFNEEWDFKHEWVPEVAEEISRALTTSPLLISVPAWYEDENGLYYRPVMASDNHATACVYERLDAFRRAFDTYDAPHIKDVRWDCTPMMIKRFWISKKVIHTFPSLWSRIWSIIKTLFNGKKSS